MAVFDEHTVRAVPATAVAKDVIVNVLVLVTFEHGAVPMAVNVSVTFPAEMSAALGVYIADVSEFAFAKAPVPLEVQFTLV